MAHKILTVSRGLVVTLQDLPGSSNNWDHDGTTSGTKVANVRSKVVSYMYNPSVTKFVKCTEFELDVAVNQIVTCCKVENFLSGLVQPCLLVNNDNEHQHSSTTLVKNETTNYQVVSFFQDHGQLIKSVPFSCHSTLSKCKVWLLNGPTICWEENGKLFIAKPKHGDPSIYVVEQMPKHLWSSGYNLKWCGATSDHVVVMATHPSKSTESSDLWFDDEASEKWMTLRCPRSDLSKGEAMTEVPPIPHPYASIVTSICAINKNSSQPVPDLYNGMNHTTDVLIIAATMQGQLLAFNGGKVHLFCDLPFEDASDIVVMSRCDGEDVILVKSPSGNFCAVRRNTFEIMQQWEGISSIYVDDFLFSGSEQMLLIPSDSTSHPLQGFILTDLDKCYIDDKERKAPDESEYSESLSCDDNLLSAIRALEARLQSGLGSLRRAEGKCDERRRLIEESQHALLTMVNGQENVMASTDQRHLLCMYDGCTQPQESQRIDIPKAAIDNVYSHIDVTDSWQRVIDGQWVVGVTLKNKSERILENISLCLIPTNHRRNLNLKLDPVTSECKVRFPNRSGNSTHNGATKLVQVSPQLAEPIKKRQKLNIKAEDAQNDQVYLEPGTETDVITVVTLPAFAGFSEMCCDMVIQWREWDAGNQVMDDGEEVGCCIDRVKSCGRVWLSAADVVSKKHGIDLMSSEFRSGEQSQDSQALDAIQMSTALHIISLHSNVSCIPAAIKSQLGFVCYEGMQDGLICPSAGVLWGVRARIVVTDSCHGQMTVSTKNKQQLMLFCHSLQHLLPDDISINPPHLPLKQMEESIIHSIQSMKQEIATHVTGLQSMQRVSMLQGQNYDVMEVDQAEGSEVSEATKVSEIRRKFKREHLQLKDGETVNISKDNITNFELDTNDHQLRTDVSVRILAKNGSISRS